MKAQELRIGNLFDYHGQSVHVMDIETSGRNNKPRATFGYFTDSVGFERFIDSEDFPKPIPLTERWLKKFGFEKSLDSFGGYLIELSMGERIRIKDDESLGWIWPLNGYHKPKTKYVHQLQNLYWCLCGKELELKQ